MWKFNLIKLMIIKLAKKYKKWKFFYWKINMLDLIINKNL